MLDFEDKLMINSVTDMLENIVTIVQFSYNGSQQIYSQHLLLYFLDHLVNLYL